MSLFLRPGFYTVRPEQSGQSSFLTEPILSESPNVLGSLQTFEGCGRTLLAQQFKRPQPVQTVQSFEFSGRYRILEVLREVPMYQRSTFDVLKLGA